MLTLLTSTGYGNTGSSAVTNILQEFAPVKSTGNDEFTFAHEPDGIADLENSLREGHRLKTDLAIKRFLKLAKELEKESHYKKCFNGKFYLIAQEYINSIIDCEWTGWWHRANETKDFLKSDNFNISLARHLFNQRYKHTISYNLYEPDGWHPEYCPHTVEYYANLNGDEKLTHFLNQTKQFTSKLIGLQDSGQSVTSPTTPARFLLLDQAVPPISFSQYMRYFEKPKVIIVDRDPRDLYVMNKSFWGSGYIPTANVSLFVKWYSVTRQPRKTELNNSNAVLFIPFESLIHEYDDSLNKIINYTELAESEHINKFKYFNPDLSSKNTRIFKQYSEFNDDISYIEKHLEQYCYNFPDDANKHEQVPARRFLIEELTNKMHPVITTGKIPTEYTAKTVLPALFQLTQYYRNYNRVKRHRGLFFCISLALSVVSLFILPFEIIFLYFKTKEWR
jgi:hypothetical protein